MMVVFLVLALAGGSWGYARYGAPGGIGSLGVLLIVLGGLYLTGNLEL